jgi:hypothetical protein
MEAARRSGVGALADDRGGAAGVGQQSLSAPADPVCGGVGRPSGIGG